MPCSSYRLLLLVGGLLVIAAVPESHAQVRVMPSVGNQPPASTRIGAAQAGVSQLTQGGNRPLGVGYRAPVGGYGAYAGAGYYPGYGGVYMGQTPANGYLTGAADVINSQANYLQTYYQTELTKQQVKQTELDTRKKTFEEWKYEQGALPTAEELRLKQAKADLDRARGNPPLTEIRSGDALNVLLTHIQQVQSPGAVGPTVPLEPELVRHINLTDGRSNTGTGLLRDGGKLDWPYPLQLEYFDAERKKTEELMGKAVAEARTGRVSAPVIKQLLGQEDALRAQLKTHIHDLTPSEGVEARRYINDLHETFRTLQDPNVAKYVGGAWTAQGNSVGELVFNMTRQGLKFAPCAQGDDSYYRTLYQALRAYDTGVSQLVSQ